MPATNVPFEGQALVLLSPCGRSLPTPLAHSQMFANIHWFLRPAELAQTRPKREHLVEVWLLIPTFFYINEFTNHILHQNEIYLSIDATSVVDVSAIAMLHPTQQSAKNLPLRDTNPTSPPWQIISSVSMQQILDVGCIMNLTGKPTGSGLSNVPRGWYAIGFRCSMGGRG